MESPLFLFLLRVMSSLFLRAAPTVVKTPSLLARCFSAHPRRLITKGVISPMNTYPKGMMVPDYIQTGIEKPMTGKISVVNDYVEVCIADDV